MTDFERVSFLDENGNPVAVPSRVRDDDPDRDFDVRYLNGRLDVTFDGLFDVWMDGRTAILLLKAALSAHEIADLLASGPEGVKEEFRPDPFPTEADLAAVQEASIDLVHAWTYELSDTYEELAAEIKATFDKWGRV